MGINFGSWLLNRRNIVQTQFPLRAQVQWARIQDKPLEIVLTRGNTKLAPQIVRLELDNGYSDASSPAGDSTLRGATIFGVRGHPDIDDLDIKLWDRFVYDDVEYTVSTVNRNLIGQIQAYCEAVG